jgi:nucleotide-binding universal stress UspA family protein
MIVKIAFNLGIEHNSTLSLLYFGEDKKAILKLEEYIEKYRENGLSADYESVNFHGQDNEIPAKIAEYADDCDIIIMGHLKFDKIYRFVHHSTAADLINIVSIPVMVIPDEGNCEFFLDK